MLNYVQLNWQRAKDDEDGAGRHVVSEFMWNRTVFVIGYHLPFIHQSLSQVHGQGQNLTKTPAKVKMQKSKKTRENQKKTIFQDSCKSKNAKIHKTSRKQKKQKTIFQDSCKSKNAKIQKNLEKPKKNN